MLKANEHYRIKAKLPKQKPGEHPAEIALPEEEDEHAKGIELNKPNSKFQSRTQVGHKV